MRHTPRLSPQHYRRECSLAQEECPLLIREVRRLLGVNVKLTMRKEFTKHECMVRLRMILGYADVFIHVKSDNILET